MSSKLQDKQEEIQELKLKIANNKNIINVMKAEGNQKEVDKAKKHLEKNEDKLNELIDTSSNDMTPTRGKIIDKLLILQEEYNELHDEYVEEYGGSTSTVNNDWNLDRLMRRIREIETVFRNLGMHPKDRI